MITALISVKQDDLLVDAYESDDFGNLQRASGVNVSLVLTFTVCFRWKSEPVGGEYLIFWGTPKGCKKPRPCVTDDSGQLRSLKDFLPEKATWWAGYKASEKASQEMHPEVAEWLAEFIQAAKDPSNTDEDMCHHLVCLGVDLPSKAICDRNPVMMSHFVHLPKINQEAHKALKEAGRLAGMLSLFVADTYPYGKERQIEADAHPYRCERKIVGSLAYGQRMIVFCSSAPNSFFRG
ncbi:hypothetical protein LCGC14_0479620 [marine sediment metagenome]|uniref:Uncharacterized protein n=1 Tax=marine sediment metagenome TaxID=412755 RepID=A0A0F9UWS7_9ZZZZ